jgi:O-antigen/teichoic acid export membrane protein
MLFSFILAFPVSLTAVLSVLKKEIRGKEFSLRPVLAYGLLCQAGVLLYLLSNKYSFYLLESNKQVGLYGTACSLMESVLVIANGISPVLMARIANSNEGTKNASATLTLSKLSTLLSILAITVMSVIPNEIYIRVLGQGYTEVKHFMMLYAPGIIVMSFISILNNYFSAVGKLKFVLYSNLIGFFVSLILSHTLIPVYGINGAAWSAVSAYTVTAACIIFIFLKQNRISVKALVTFSREELKVLLPSGNKTVQ